MNEACLNNFERGAFDIYDRKLSQSTGNGKLEDALGLLSIWEPIREWSFA